MIAAVDSRPDFAPDKECKQCPRLAEFRALNQRQYPAFFNGAVPSFGTINAELLIVGLAPGLKGANATGRPFTGDYAGDILYPALIAAGFAAGVFARHQEDGMYLVNTRITNAVRCVPPANKPLPSEIKSCNQYLQQEIAAMVRLRIILTLGQIAHNAVLHALGQKQSSYKFNHAAIHKISPPHSLARDGNHGHHIYLYNSYHTSRYNINTKRLTTDMFSDVINNIKQHLEFLRDSR